MTASIAATSAPPTDIVEREATAPALGTPSSLSPCSNSILFDRDAEPFGG